MKSRPPTTGEWLLALLAVLVLLCGCSVTSGTRRPDGSLTVTSIRFLWASEAVDFSATNGEFATHLRIGRSAVDAASVSAVTEGVVKGLTRP